MAATGQVPDVVVAHVGDHFQRARIAAEEMLAHVGAVIGLERLVVTVVAFHHDLLERAILVACQQRIPAGAPDQLDDVPASTTELAFEFLDDLAVAAHRAVQALQVAVDDEDQVVELFTRSQANGAQRFDFVHLAVAAEHPDLAVFSVGNAACVQVFEESSLVNGHQRAQAHRDSGKLPEVGHQLGMRIARQALAVDFLAEVEQLLFGQAAFQVSAGIHAGRNVALNVEAVAAMVFVLGMPKMVETGAKHAGQRGKRANVATQIAAVGRAELVGLDHHGHGIPAHVGAQALLNDEVAGRTLFLINLDGVDIAGGGRERHVDTALASVLKQLFKQEVGALGAATFNHCGQRIHPLSCLLCVVVLHVALMWGTGLGVFVRVGSHVVS